MNTVVVVDLPAWADTLASWLTTFGLALAVAIAAVFGGALVALGILTAWDKVKDRFDA